MPFVAPKSPTTTLSPNALGSNNPRLKWLKIQGKEILLLDFSHAAPQESLDLMKDFRQLMESQGPASVLMLTNVTGAGYDSAVSTKWKSLRPEIDSKLRASAIYGLSGLVGIAVQSVVEAARLIGWPLGKDILRVFKTADEATAWLVQR